MTLKDWRSFRNAADCHICNKSLIKDGFLDSLPVWNVEEAGEEGGEKWSYWGQGHKTCFYEAQKKKEKKWGVQKFKGLREEKHKSQAKSQENCTYCGYIPRLTKYQLYRTT